MRDLEKTRGIKLDETDLGDLGDLEKDLSSEYKKIKRILGWNDPMDVSKIDDLSRLDDSEHVPSFVN